MPETARQLAAQFDLADALRIEPGPGETPRLAINTAECVGHHHLHGSTVTHWQPADQTQPVLFLSNQAVFREGKGIRGGVPICFPWFAGHPTDPDAPAHGLVRGTPWRLAQTSLGPDGVTIDTLHHLDHLKAEYRVSFGSKLIMQLTISNTSDTDQSFEAALHTYFRVGDIHQVKLTGLENTTYLDTVGGGRTPQQQDDQPVTFTAETDRIYQNTQATCTLTDPSLGRRIIIEKLGSDSTVVWNPWIDRAAAFADFGDDEWQQMCCVESANIADHAVTIAPGEHHTLRVLIRTENL